MFCARNRDLNATSLLVSLYAYDRVYAFVWRPGYNPSVVPQKSSTSFETRFLTGLVLTY